MDKEKSEKEVLLDILNEVFSPISPIKRKDFFLDEETNWNTLSMLLMKLDNTQFFMEKEELEKLLQLI